MTTASDHRRPLGQRGEQLAAEHLQRQGYTIRTRNWRCKHGEMDIIALQNATLVFVEVRTRHADSTDASFESITPRKRAKLSALAHTYLAEHELENMDWRVDVIAVIFPRSGQPMIEQVEDALDW